MEFSVRSNDEVVELFGEGLVLDSKEKEDIHELLGNMVYGCALVISTVIHRKTRDSELRKKLADFSVKMLQDVLAEHFEEEDDPIAEEGYLYNKMVEMYEDWFENECSYENEEELIKEIKELGVMPCLLYNDDNDSIDVYLEPDDEHFFCNFSEMLGSVPAELYEENQVRAEATVMAFQLIATVLYDKAFGEDDNPLRADDWINLDKQLNELMSDCQ